MPNKALRPIQRFFLMTLLLASSVGADTGKVYRWVDARGQVHYSDQADLSAHEIKQKAPVTSSAPTPDTAGSNDTGSTNACQSKKEQLISYQHAAKITETDGLGNTREYSAAETQKLIELTEKSIHELCSPN